MAIGDLDRRDAVEEIDLAGRAVAPGFVDIHSHADLILLADESERNRLLEAKLRQGVTTIVVGNCGLGPAPADDAAAELLAAVNGWMTPDGVAAGAIDTAAYLSRLERAGLPLNVATLVPHGPLRISAMGLAPGAPSAAQLGTMKETLRRSLQAGAFGLSCGLIYPPGIFSPTDELTALAEIVAANDRLFTAHIRGSSELLLDATHELIAIARASGARTHHSHLEAVGERFWPMIPKILEAEDAARREGLSISHDLFPYTRAATMMSAIFPPWSLAGGLPGLLERLADGAARERIRADLEQLRPEWPPWGPDGWPHNLVRAVGWDAIYVASVGPDGPTDYVGRSLQSIATERQLEPFDVVADLMLSEHGRVGQWVGEISGDAALLEILKHPSTALISDAEDYGRGLPHPAHAGAFPRALRLNRDHELMGLGEMIHKMTAYPASIVGLESTGTLTVGSIADLVVFDPAQVRDHAGWLTPRAAPEGITRVMVQGRWVVADGRYTPGSAGRVLRAR